MQQAGKEQFFLTKAYGVSYAVFRIAARIQSPAMKEHLERQALSLLDAAAVENYVWAGIVSKAIEYLMRFGSDVGIIHEDNSATVISELNVMNAAISGLEKPTLLTPVPLDDIFAEQNSLFPRNSAKGDVARTVPQSRVQPTRVHPKQGVEDEATNVGSEIRQSAILDRIRQSGNCRMKDIQEILPDLSERMIRYNLQSMVEQDLIEKVGNGGPGVFYKLRDGAQTTVSSANPGPSMDQPAQG